MLVTLSGLSKTFDNGVRALGPLDLSVGRGAFVSLVGPSGCGKSTALRVMAGLMAPTGGTVDFPGGRPRIGFVFQEPTLMPWASALANVRLPLDLAGVARAEGDARAAAALVQLGLAGFEDALPRELSGGMRMRVSLARALVGEPELLLLDEPFAALDEQTRAALNDDLIGLWHARGLTVVFVTHSVLESAYLSTRVVVMSPRPGRVRADIALEAPVADAQRRFTPEFGARARAISDALQAGMVP